jgi:hypothetical protein
MDQQAQIIDLQNQVNDLKSQINQMRAGGTFPYDIDQAIRTRVASYAVLLSQLPPTLLNAPLNAVLSPTGGATIDSPARSAIDSIITRLEDLGLINPN